MKKSTLIHTFSLLSFLALASCKNFNDIVTDLSSPFVTEAPYHKPRTNPVSPISPPPTQTFSHPAPSTPSQLAHNVPKPPTTNPAPKPAPKPATAQIKKPTPMPEKIDLADNTLSNKDKAPSGSTTAAAPKPPTPPTQPTQPKPAPVDENPVLTVKPVPGKPTHVYHPIDPSLTIRIADKAGNIPASGTIMRVPNTDIRFVVP